MKSFEQFLHEAKKVTIDVDWADDDDEGLDKKHSKTYGVKIKVGRNGMTADITGEPKKLIKFLKGPHGMEDEDIADLYPELYE